MQQDVLTVIESNKLRKVYGQTVALADVSLSVRRGEVLTLLGPNGAGKTTTVNLLATLVRPTSGSATVMEHDIVNETSAVRKSVALLPQGSGLDPFLSVFDNLRFYAMLARLDSSKWRSRAEELLTELDLQNKRRHPVMSLSGGQFRRAQIARVLLSDAPILFIDEPTLGIDIDGKLKVWDLLDQYRKQSGWTVLLSTNDIAEAERLSDRIVFIRQGSVQCIGTPDELTSQISRRLVRIRYHQPPLKEPDNLPESARLEISGNTAIISVNGSDTDVAPIVAMAAQWGEIEDLSVDRPNLTDVFHALQEDQR